MPAMQHLVEGIDPTLNTNPVTKADLLELVRNAKPVQRDGSPEGWVIWSETAPNVITNPELASYLWGTLDEDGNKTGDFYYYEDGSWQPLPIVDGSKLANNSVPLNKLNADGAAAYDIIQRNAANNSWVIVSIPTAVQNDSLAPAKLTSPDNTNDYILVSQAGVKAFVAIDTIIAMIDAGDITLDLLETGAANTFLRMKPDGSEPQWTTADISDLLAAGYTAGQSIRRNVGNTGWEGFTPTSFAITPLTNGGAFWAIPGSAAVQSVPHGLGVKPTFARVVFIKTSAAADGYTVGDEIDVASIVVDTGSDFQQPLVTIGYDSTNINVSVTTHTGTVWFNAKGGGSVAFDSTAWKIKAYVA